MEGQHIIDNDGSVGYHNKDKNDNKDDDKRNDDDDGKDSSSSSDDDDDNINESKNTKKLNSAIATIKENKEPKIVPYLRIHDDKSAVRVGRALRKNTSLMELKVKLGRGVADAQHALSNDGVQAIMNGLLKQGTYANNIARLFVHVSDNDFKKADLRPTLLHFVESAIPIVPTLVIQMYPSYEQACEMKMLLGMGTDITKNSNVKRLHKTLYIQIGDEADLLLSKEQMNQAWQVADKHQDDDDWDHRNSSKIMCIKEQMQKITDGYLLHVLFLKAFDHVQELILGFGLPDEDAIVLSMALAGNTTLKTLRIEIGCSMRIPTARHLTKGIQRSRIVHLDLEGPVRFITSPLQVQEILYDEGVRNSTVRELTLRAGMKCDQALTQCLPKLQSFVLNNYFAGVSSTLLVDLWTASQLVVLDLKPILDATNMLRVCDALPHLTWLTSLSIHGSLTCEAGDQLVLAQLHDRQSFLLSGGRRSQRRRRKRAVTIASLESRNIQPTVAERLMIAVANHPCLVQLDLSGSMDIGYLGLETIGRHLDHVQLEKLNINVLKDRIFNREAIRVKDFVNEDLKQAIHRAGEALVGGIRSNAHLRELHVSLPSKIAAELDFYLELNNRGRYLLHVDGGVPPDVWCRVLGQCGDLSVIYYFLREQPQLMLLQPGSIIGQSET